MPLVSPKEIVLPIINLMIILIINSPNRMKTNDLEGIRKISLFLISNFDVFIRKMEKNMPIMIASSTSTQVTRNSGTINMNAPVLIKIGGKMIFFTVAGFLEAFNRIKIINVAMPAATTVLATIQNI